MKEHDSEKKLAELILYISDVCSDDKKFGATKLNKILYFADFYHYGKTGVAITGAQYQKLPNGPAPVKLLPVEKRLVADRAFAIQEKKLASGFVQKKPISLRPPDLSMFTAEEIATVDFVIGALRQLTAQGVSDFSHSWCVGWSVVDDNEIIPYNTVFFSNAPLSEAELARGYEVAVKHGAI